MDFSQIIQGTRQYFQGHPGLDEATKNQRKPVSYPVPPGHTAESWLPRSGKTVDIPPEIEARYANHALRLPASNGHPPPNQGHVMGYQEHDLGRSKLQTVNGSNLVIQGSEHHERPKTEGSAMVLTSKTQKPRAETPLDLSVKPDEPVVIRGPPNFLPSQDPALIHQWSRTAHPLPVQTSTLKVDSYQNHGLPRPQQPEVQQIGCYSVPENPHLGHHQLANSVICRAVQPGEYRQEQRQHSLIINPQPSSQVTSHNRPISEPCPSDCRKPEHNHYTPGLRFPAKSVAVSSSEVGIQRPQAVQHHPSQYHLYQPYQHSAESSPAERIRPPQSYSETYAQFPQQSAGPTQTQHTLRQFLPPEERPSIHHSSPYAQPLYPQSYPQQPGTSVHRPAQPQPHLVEIGHRPHSQPLHDSRQPPLISPHPQSSEPIRWTLPQQHFESRLPSLLQTQLQPSEPVQRPPSQQHHDARPPSAQQLRAVPSEPSHLPPTVERDSRLPPHLHMHSHPQFRNSDLPPHQAQTFHQPQPHPHPSGVMPRPQHDGRSAAPYLMPSQPVHRPQSPQQPPGPFPHYIPGQPQTISRSQAVTHTPLRHPFPSVPPTSVPHMQQLQQRAPPPVATVSATVRSSAAGSPAIPPSKILTPGVGSKIPQRDPYPLPSRPTFPWLQRNNSRSDGKVPHGIPPTMGGPGTSTKTGKPVGVAMVSFKSAPSTTESPLGPSWADGPAGTSTTSMAPYAKETSKPRELNLATHPFPHLAAAAAAASAKSSSAMPMPLKFRTKAELKQMSNLTTPPTIPSPSLGAHVTPSAIPVPVVVSKPVFPPPPPVLPPDPIIEDEKWAEFSKPLTNEWESFMKDLKESTNIKRICRVTKPAPKPAAKRGRQAQNAKAPSPPPVKKNIHDYSSDEDIPLSLRQKVIQDQQRANRLEQRKRRRASTRIRVCKRRIMSDSESESQSDDSDSSASVSFDEDDSDSEESSDSDDGTTIVDRLRLRRSTVIQRSHSLNSATSSSSSGKSRQSSSSSSSYPSGWEGDALIFKQQLRMPPQLINVCKPRNGREVPDPQESKDKKAVHHIRCANTGTKWKRDSRARIKRKLSHLRVRKGNRLRAAIHSNFAWNNRWNYHMFRTSLFYSACGIGRKRRTRRSTKSIETRKRTLAKRIRKGLKSAKTKQVASAMTPTTKRLRVTRRRFRSGFDYIRKKKKKTVTANSSDQRPKAPNKDYQMLGATLDPATEVRSWVLNKSLGETLLHRAARLGYLEGVLYLLERSETNVSAKDNAGYTPLHEACTKGHLEVARILLQYGASESSSAQGGIRPLHQAVENDHVEVVRLLLSFGADPTLATYGGQTPLMCCESDAMRLFLTAHLDDINGVTNRSWVFEGSASFMDKCENGVVEHPLNSSSYVDAFHSRALSLDSSRSFDAVDIQLYELVDRRLNPWLQLDPLVDYLVKGRGPPHMCDASAGSVVDQQEVVSRQLAHQLIADTSAARITLSAQSFASLAVPVLRRGLRSRPVPHSARPLVLLHYNERVQKLLDVESVTFSL